MQKVISLFKRDYETKNRLVFNEVVPGAEWVQDGQGVATAKWDGTSCLISMSPNEIRISKRYDAKNGKQPPPDFTPSQEPDPVTGHWPGWVPCRRDNPQDRWFFEAFDTFHSYNNDLMYPGTYELVGPKVQSNPYKLSLHELWRHGTEIIEDAPRTFDALRDFFASRPTLEGIVWHHPDGRMVKIKRKDFGLPWPQK